jgi:hypothetical protein
MPLIDLKTNLKSLGYGNDRPDGGSSNQPYIVAPIPDGETSNSPDFLLRNGYLNPVNSVKDTERLIKYFFDLKSPSGLLFTAKQQLLERQNPKLVNINRIYLPTSTTAQAGVLSIGGHLNKQGLDASEPSYYIGGTYGYYFSTKNQTITDGLENRLTIAYTAKIAKQELGLLTINPFGITRIAGDNILLSYPGGPGSILGIGLTNIRIQNPTRTVDNIKEDQKFQPSFFSTLVSDPKYLVVNNGLRPSINWKYNPRIENPGVSNAFIFQQNLEENQTPFYPDDSANLLLNRKDIPASSVDTNNNIYLFDYSQSFSQESKFTYKSTALVGIKDFRQTINNNEGENVIPSTDYSIFNRETKYQTSVTTYRGNYKNGNYVLDPNEFISPDQTEKGDEGEDIIDFNFNIQNPSGQNRLVDFRAYLETWNDGVKAEWSPIKYMGRAENFYKYNGFSRDTSVIFLVPALSRADMLVNYRKLNALIWSVSPDYSPTTKESNVAGLMRGSITKFTMGNYFKGMPCIIKSVDFNEIEGMGWDINRDLKGEIIPLSSGSYVGQLPKGIKVTVSLTPIHNFVPQYGEAFIGQDNKYVPDLYSKGLGERVLQIS